MEPTLRTILSTALLLVAVAAATPARAQALDVLSGGAVEPGILAAAAQYNKDTGANVKVRFATAPQILKQVGDGAKADIVLAPPRVIDDLVKAGKLDAGLRPNVGKVGVGVASRKDGPTPDIATTEALKKSVLAAGSIVFNTASSGLYIERMFEKLGIAAEVKAKAKRYPTGAAVMEHLVKGTGNEFGFGPQTEIAQYLDKGLRRIGPLPADVQNFTTYHAVMHTGSTDAGAAKAFLQYLATPAARKIFAANGVE